MKLAVGEKLNLSDSANRELGDVRIERVEGDLVLGQFTSKPAFRKHETLFRQFEDAANAQALPIIDELEEKIARLGFCIIGPGNGTPIKADDVQIWSDGGISFRIRAMAQKPARR